MSETYVVALVKHYHATEMFESKPSEVMGCVDFEVERWTDRPEQRAWIKDAAERFFYAIAEALVEHEIKALIREVPEHGEHQAVYWGDFVVEDDHIGIAYQVSIFRHYFSEARLS